MLEYVTLPAALKQNYGNKAEWYGEKIVAEAKQESLLSYTDNVKITPVDYYKFILRFSSLIFKASLTFITQHDEMVVNSVHPCCA